MARMLRCNSSRNIYLDAEETEAVLTKHDSQLQVYWGEVSSFAFSVI